MEHLERRQLCHIFLPNRNFHHKLKHLIELVILKNQIINNNEYILILTNVGSVTCTSVLAEHGPPPDCTEHLGTPDAFLANDV